MFSSASSLSAWKSGCRNSQLCEFVDVHNQISTPRLEQTGDSYILAKLVIGVPDLKEGDT